MKERLIKFVVDFEILYDKILVRLTTIPSFAFLRFNKAFWNILYEYKGISIQHYANLFSKFFNQLKTRDFWYSILYNKEKGLIANLMLYLFLAPIFRFISRIIGFIFTLIFGIYYLLINLMFDMIIKYVDIYARKWRILYDPLAIEELNDLRKVFLFVDFSKNFMAIFTKKKQRTLDDVVYKEELSNRVIIIFMNFVLFFIWWVPVFLSFLSYFVRFIYTIIKGRLNTYRWYVTNKIVRILRWIYLLIGHRLKLYRFRYWVYSKKILQKRSRLKRKTVIGLNSFYNKILKNLLKKIYYKVSLKFFFKNLFLRIRLIFAKIYLKFLGNYINRDYKTFIDLKEHQYNKYNSDYYISRIPFFLKDHFNLKLFEIISNIINDHIVYALNPLAYIIKDVNKKTLANFYNSIISEYKIIIYGFIVNILNYHSIVGSVFFFINRAINFDFLRFLNLNFFYKRYRLRYLKFKFWFVYNIYYNIFNQIYIFICICFLKLYRHIYHFSMVLWYILMVLYYILRIIVRTVYVIIVLIIWLIRIWIGKYFY